MPSLKRLAALASILTVSTLAVAHGPQIQITDTNDQIVTRNLFPNEPYDAVLSSPTSVYVLPLVEEPNGEYYIQPNDETNPSTGNPLFPSGPGIAYGIGLTFTPGYHFNLSFVDGLKYWNGSTWTDPGTEEIQAYRGSEISPTSTASTSDSGPFESLAFSDFTAGSYSTGSHASVSYVMLGDGIDPLTSSDDGVYLLSLQLSSTQPGLAASDTFYFVLYKNVGHGEALAAAASLGFDASQIQYVPEGSTFAMLGAAAMVVGTVRVWRRRAANVNQ